MDGNTIVRSRFDQLISDAFALAAVANSDSGSSPSRLARASIIHSALVVEALANCCLKDVPVGSKLYCSLEQLRTIDKLEFYAVWLAPKTAFDRGSAPLQKISELISLRNTYVHPKIRTMDGEQWKYLKISKNADEWGYTEAESIFKTVMEFLEYYFHEICKLTHDQISPLLRSHIKSSDGTAKQMHRMVDHMMFVDIATFLDSDLVFLGFEPGAIAELRDTIDKMMSSE